MLLLAAFYVFANNQIIVSMKNIFKLIYIALISVLMITMFSCGDKKEDCSSTAVLGSYFPAYPSSYWNYHNNKNGITTWRIAGDYEKFDGSCATYFNNADCYILNNSVGYSIDGELGGIKLIYSDIYPLEIGVPEYAGMSFIDFSIKDDYNDKPITRYRESLGYKTISLDSINIYENTLIVKEFDTLIPKYFYLDYFANNVGLVMRDSVSTDSLGMDTTRILWLKDYKIYK